MTKPPNDDADSGSAGDPSIAGKGEEGTHVATPPDSMSRVLGDADTVMANITAEIARPSYPLQGGMHGMETEEELQPEHRRTQKMKHPPSSGSLQKVRSVRSDELPIAVGDTVDHFTLEKELGRGGMGIVFLARDNSLDRLVALKVIVTKQGDAVLARERFFREARAQAKLTSPHVVHIHYIGTATHHRRSTDAAGDDARSSSREPATYFAMEYVQGESLEALLERGETLSPERARILMLEVARGLREAHEAGFIHRDIKPSNLLVEAPAANKRGGGHLKIADFGLAKPLSGVGGTLTADGIVLGTPMYMPPEQIESTNVDHRADMYALGASFWNLLAGKPPYDGETSIAIFAKHINDPVPSLRAAAPAVPVALANIIERLMQKDREKRYATYDDLITALENAAPGFVEPAGFSIRGAAAAIDLGIGAALVGFTGPIGVLVYALFLIAGQAWRGQTLGKYLVRIRAERLDGSPLGPFRATVRLAAAAWLPLYWASVILLTQGHHDLFAGIGEAAKTDDLRGFLTAFVVQHVFFSLLYAVSLGLAAVHPSKRAVHDLLVRSRVVHVRLK